MGDHATALGYTLSGAGLVIDKVCVLSKAFLLLLIFVAQSLNIRVMIKKRRVAILAFCVTNTWPVLRKRKVFCPITRADLMRL